MRNDFVKQAEAIKSKTANQMTALRTAGAKQMKLYCAVGNTPTADSGVFVEGVEPWEAGKAYAKNDLFSYEGNLGYVKQAHTSQAHWKPFTTGVEALYGARPAPDADGVYPYVYNMAADVGMIVRDPDDGNLYECIQAVPDMLYKPHEIAAHFIISKQV